MSNRLRLSTAAFGLSLVLALTTGASRSTAVFQCPDGAPPPCPGTCTGHVCTIEGRTYACCIQIAGNINCSPCGGYEE